MSQFEIQTWVDLPAGLDFTNSAFFMLLSVVLATALLTMGMSKRALVPGRLQSVVELTYEFVADMIRGASGNEGLRFFPFVFTIFVFVLTANMLGMIPYAFTTTSHIIVTFGLAMAVILLVIIVGFAKNGLGFLKLFAPSGLPLWLLPLMIVIEVISFLTRPISLAVRLFANMLAGHTMLKVFGGFVVSLSALGPVGILGALVPLLGTIAVTGLEFLVAFLQAYVFAMLTCIYLNDALHPSH